MQRLMSNPLPMSMARGQSEEPVLPAAAAAHGDESAAQAPAMAQGFVLPVTGTGELAAVTEQLAAWGEESEAPQEQDDPALDENAEAGAAEQWLLGMLGQQQAQVQARENLPAAAGVAQRGERRADGVDNLPRPVQAQTGTVQAQPQLALDSAPQAAAPARNAQQGSDTDAALSALLARAAQQPADGAPATSGVAAGEQPAVAALAAPATHGAALPGTQAEAAQPAPAPLQQHLRLETPQAKWGEQMLSALRDNVEMQLQQKVQSATIRLDPPELGSLEILLSHDSGRLQVQISASHGDVARLLQQTSERLRQELVGQNFLQVEVQVGNGQSGQAGQQQARRAWASGEEGAVMANEQPDSGADERRGAAQRDVLITV